MPRLMGAPPFTLVDPVTDILHGVPVTDPYRWLEDGNSPRTREWLEEQRLFARAYLDSIPGRDRIRQRIREFLAVETYDSLQKAGNRYFFRKRLPNQEQPCICMREGADGEDQLLIDPAERGTGKYVAVRPLRVSPDGRLLLYQVKEGGEETGTFEIVNVETREVLPDALPRGYLRGFAFTPQSNGFYYSHEVFNSRRPFYRAAYLHILGNSFSVDKEVFYAGEDQKLRLCLISDRHHLGFIVYKLLEKLQTDFYLKPLEDGSDPELFISAVDYSFGPILLPNRIWAITNLHAPNYRIVEVRSGHKGEAEFTDVVPESDLPIKQFAIVQDHVFVSYVRQTNTKVLIFNVGRNKIGTFPVSADETIRILGNSTESDELVFETESFTRPIAIHQYSPNTSRHRLWAEQNIPFDPKQYGHIQVWYTTKDGTGIPMFLMGRKEVLEGKNVPVIMTAYGGHGICMTPKFSVFVALLVERGCLFALPNIRGGAEFGKQWHGAAKRAKRQNAYDDFLGAAEWLISAGRTSPRKLAIFGGSNSGLLVGAALTQRPDLFRAVLCMVPILDMVRYHLFDAAHLWKDEYGTSENPDDFAALIKYSPYHNVHYGVTYPATMIVSGDADGHCNPFHARKMTAHLQAANSSEHLILLDYTKYRGHSPVLPLSERVEALTDRVAFFCDQLQLPADGGRQ